MRPHVVQAHALGRAFGDVHAVAALTFDVADGELFGVVGPDGAGKTTLLRLLAGVLPPTSGDATIRGVSVARDPERVKPHIAYMSQRFGLYTDLTVRENIMFYADLYRVPQRERAARLERLYAFSRLGEFEHRLAGKLSGGMKQKLGLCCALIHAPDVLLLDEPTFGVDPISRRDLWLILHQMIAAGTTIIVTTSYMDEAERCDRVALLDGGRLLALAAPAAIQARLEGRLLRVRAGRLHALQASLRTDADVVRATLFGDALHVLARDAGAAGRIESELGGSAFDVATVTRPRPSLEDAFIELVGNGGSDSVGGRG